MNDPRMADPEIAAAERKIRDLMEEYEYGVRWPDGQIESPHRNEQPWRPNAKPIYSHRGVVFVRRRVVREEWKEITDAS